MQLAFLTDEERIALTGRQRKTAQVEWFSAHGWRFEVDADGWPVVARAEAERRLTGTTHSARPQEPNFAALNALGRG